MKLDRVGWVAWVVALAPLACTEGDTTEQTTGRIVQAVSGLGFKVEQHHGEDWSATNNELKPHFRILNTSGAAVPLAELQLRYFFTREGEASDVSQCLWAQVGQSNLIHQVHALSEAESNADHYLQVGFSAGAGSIPSGANSGEMKLAVHKTDWLAYDESDDYSYIPSATTWVEAPAVALYRNGVLVWGTEPDGGGTGTGGGSGVGGAASGGGPSTGGVAGASGAGNTTNVEFEVQLPVDVGLHGVALGATEALVVADGVVVSSATGDQRATLASVGAQETNLGVESWLGGDVVSIGQVKIRDRGTVDGNVTTTGNLSWDNTYTITGSLSQGETLTPTTVLHWSVGFPPPAPVDIIEPGQTLSLPPGSYQNVSVHPGGVVSLSSGTYYMVNFTTESGSTVELDASTGPVIVYVKEGLTHRGQVGGALADDYFIGFAGSGMADIDSPFGGTVVAPNAHLRLSPVDGSGHEGSFFARRVENDARNPLQFTPFGHWDWILPPRLIVECLTRSAAGYGAGMFGYENVLDIEVEIPEGPRNAISADTRLHKGPLERFLPGEHRNAYSIPFKGDALEWFLVDQVARVDDSVERCTLDDYDIVPVSSLPEPLEPMAQELVATLVPLSPSPVQVLPLADILSPVAETLQPPGLAVMITGLGIGSESCTVGSLDVHVKVYAYDETALEHTEARHVFDSGWSLGDLLDDFMLMPGIVSVMSGEFEALDEVFFVPTYEEQPTIPLKIIEWEIDDNMFCNSAPEVEFRLNVNRDTLVIESAVALDEDGNSIPAFYFPPNPDMTPENGDPTLPHYCAYGQGDWAMCFQLLPATPKICADFPAQLLDSGRGEDRLTVGGVQQVRASHARVRLDVTGGQVPFEPWPEDAYAVLDADGCLPPEAMPSAGQLTPASADFAVTLTWLGTLSAPVGEGEGEGEELVFQIDRMKGDPWTACGRSGTPYLRTAPQGTQAELESETVANPCYPYPDASLYAPAGSSHTVTAGSGWNPIHTRFVIGSEDGNPTEYSNAAALAAHMLRMHADDGKDMGFSPGTIHIWPESVLAFIMGSPYHSATRGNSPTERFVHARPRWSSVQAGGTTVQHESDLNRKFVMAHEIGHAVHYMGVGDTGGSYGFQMVGPTDSDAVGVETQSDPDGFPVECRCNHIGNEFLPWHCMNSVEVAGAAFGEGIGHFMAARSFNEPEDPAEDCWFLYTKWALVPPAADGSCPSSGVGYNPCVQVGSAEGSAIVNERYSLQDDQNRLLNELAGWYFIPPPAQIACSDAVRWRNTHCASVASAPFATPTLLNNLGTELDWMQFLWNLSRGANAWTPTQFWGLQRAACAERLCEASEWPTADGAEWPAGCEPQLCMDSSTYLQHSTEPWPLYEQLAVVRPPPMAMTQLQWNQLTDYGDNYGVSTDLTPAP